MASKFGIIFSSLFLSLSVSAKVDCSAKNLDKEMDTPKNCNMVTIKAWGGGAAGIGKHGLGGAFASSDFELPPGSRLTVHIGAGGKADKVNSDGETTIVSYAGKPLLLALGGQAAETENCIAYPGFQRNMSKYDYPKDATPASSSDPDYVKANHGAKPGHGYAYGVAGAEGMCGLVTVACKKDDPKAKK